MDVTVAVVTLVGAGISLIATWLATVLVRGRIYRLVEEFAWTVVAGIEQRSLRDTLLDSGEKKLAEATRIVGLYASRLGLRVDSEEVASFIRTVIESAVFTQKGSGTLIIEEPE